MPKVFIGGNRHFVTFVDDYSTCGTVYFLKRGAKVPDNLKLFERCVANDICQKTASLLSNNGGEYLSPKYESYFEAKEIHPEMAALLT